MILQHTLYWFLAFLVKGKVKLDGHEGQHQQSNCCEGDEETWRLNNRSYLMLFICFYCQKTGWASPRESAVLAEEEGCSLALRCVICLVGDVIVVAVVVNSPGVWAWSWCWWPVCDETTLASVGNASTDMSVCDLSLQMTSEVLVPLTCTPNLHLQRITGDPRVWKTGHY